MKTHDGCHLCKIVYKSEVVAVQHMLGIKHHKRYEIIQREMGKPISHFCPICGVGNIPDMNLWEVHLKSALHKTNLDQYMQIFYAQKMALKQSKSKESTTVFPQKSSKKGDSSYDTLQRIRRSSSQFSRTSSGRGSIGLFRTFVPFITRFNKGFYLELNHHDNEEYGIDNSSLSVLELSKCPGNDGELSHRTGPPRLIDVRSYPQRKHVMGSERRHSGRFSIQSSGRGASRNHSDPRYPPQLFSSNKDHHLDLYNDHNPPAVHPLPRPFYAPDESYFTSERRREETFEPPLGSHNWDDKPLRYPRDATFNPRNGERLNDRYQYVRPRTPDTRNVFDYRHTRHFSEEPAHPSEIAHSGYPQSYYSSHPYRHGDRTSHYSPNYRKRGSVPHSHRTSHPSSHENHSPQSTHRRSDSSHTHINPTSTSHDVRNISHSNRRSSPQNNNRETADLGHKGSEKQNEAICRPKGDKLGTKIRPTSDEIEIVQIETESETVKQIEGVGPTTDQNPGVMLEKEPAPHQELQNGNSGEGKTEVRTDKSPDCKPKRQKTMSQGRKERASPHAPANMSQLEQNHCDLNQSTSPIFSPSDRHTAFMTTVQKTHEALKLSEEIERINEDQTKLTYYIRQLKFIRSQKREEKRQLRRRRSALLAEMNQSDSQAETGSSDEFDDTTPTHMGVEDPPPPEDNNTNQTPAVTTGEKPSAAGSEAPAEAQADSSVAAAATADPISKPEESKRETRDAYGRLIISIDDDEDDKEAEAGHPSKRSRSRSIAEIRGDSMELHLDGTGKHQGKRRRRASESLENVPPDNHQAETSPSTLASLHNAILLQTLGETSSGAKPEAAIAETAVEERQVEGGSKVDPNRLRFVRRLLSHPRCMDYTFDELDNLINDYYKDKLLQSQKVKKNQG